MNEETGFLATVLRDLATSTAVMTVRMPPMAQ